MTLQTSRGMRTRSGSRGGTSRQRQREGCELCKLVSRPRPHRRTHNLISSTESTVAPKNRQLHSYGDVLDWTKRTKGCRAQNPLAVPFSSRIATKTPQGISAQRSEHFGGGEKKSSSMAKGNKMSCFGESTSCVQINDPGPRFGPGRCLVWGSEWSALEIRS